MKYKSDEEVKKEFEARYQTWYDLHRKETGYFPIEKQKLSFVISFILQLRTDDKEAIKQDLIEEIEKKMEIFELAKNGTMDSSIYSQGVLAASSDIIEIIKNKK